MIRKITATNFRSFDRLDVDLAPITLFVGPNNSGKSSVISLIRLLSQTLGSNDPNVRLLLNGAHGDFGTYKDLIHENETRRHLDISLLIQPQGGARILGASKESISLNLHYKYRSSLKEVILSRLELFGDNKSQISAEFIDDSEKFILRTIGKNTIPRSNQTLEINKFFDVKNFLPRIPAIGLSHLFNDPQAKSIEATLKVASRNATAISRTLQEIEYVGAMRIPPSRTYLYTGERRQKVGATGEHAINMLVMDAMRKGSKSKGIRQGVINWLAAAGIASDIKIYSLSDRHFELHVQHPITGEYANFADVGYGNSQVIPVLIGGLNTAPGSTYIVEEPEIHLHPKAQAELGDFFLSLSQRGIQSIIETHSEHMIIRLQKHVAAGLLAPDDIHIYYVNPTKEGKKLEKLELTPSGHFKSEWPGGFFPERLNEARDLAMTRSSMKI